MLRRIRPAPRTFGESWLSRWYCLLDRQTLDLLMVDLFLVLVSRLAVLAMLDRRRRCRRRLRLLSYIGRSHAVCPVILFEKYVAPFVSS